MDKEDKLTWDVNHISEVFLTMRGSTVEEITEYISYDVGDMFGDVGGYVGMLLVWSLLSIAYGFFGAIREFKTYNFFH